MSQVQHFTDIIAQLESKLAGLKQEEERIAQARAPLQLAVQLGDADATAHSDMLKTDLLNTRAAIEDIGQAIGQAKFRLAAAEKDAAAQERQARLRQAKRDAEERLVLAEKIDVAVAGLNDLFEAFWTNTRALSEAADVTGVTSRLWHSPHRLERAIWALAPAFGHFTKIPLVLPKDRLPLADGERQLIARLLAREEPATELDLMISEEAANGGVPTDDEAA